MMAQILLTVQSPQLIIAYKLREMHIWPYINKVLSRPFLIFLKFHGPSYQLFSSRRRSRLGFSNFCVPGLVLTFPLFYMSNGTFVASESGSDSEAENGIAVIDYTEVIVVRHGETAWNAEGRIQGHLDVELNDVGRRQAIAVADRLAKEREISAVYSSDLKRARDTAHVIASRCNVPVVIEDPNLRERHLGDLQGFALHEAAELKPDAYKASLSSSIDQEIPGGGESFGQLYQRCSSSLQKIGRQHKGQRVVVVTHGGVLRAFHKYATPNVELPGKIKNASINIFHMAGEEGTTVKIWGEVAHLSTTGFLETVFGGDGNSG